MKKTAFIILSLILTFGVVSRTQALEQGSSREHLLMDFGWRFALGHPYDPDKDFGFGTGYFSYFAKAGYGDGPADPHFDDRAWRLVNLPHDWAVEQPFDEKGSYSHGFKAIGRAFPEASVGWYRKTFFIPKSDQGRRISIEFDGVYRDAAVFVNGFYMGKEESGYNNFRYDITDDLNYGRENTVVVRVDATMEEGWFYEGAGIYRHVWLTKTAPLHIDYNGTFVISEVVDDATLVTAKTTVVDDGNTKTLFEVDQEILDEQGKSVAVGRQKDLTVEPGSFEEFSLQVQVPQPKLWSIESPYLYKLVTTVKSEGEVVDRTETTFGIRTITFDPDKGMFLNGQHVELKGTSNHQDHAGVGVALPDALQYYRIKKLKEMGCNAYRCAHNPPTPELLDACDKLGMLVLVENRLMGTSPEILDRLKRMILLDRNHPCVFAWSLGNEEWAMEGNEKGAQIVPPMQDFVKRLDPTRRVTAADSGGWGKGTSTVIDLMGYNYYEHGDTDEQHKNYPNQPSMATEESDTHQTRGIYEDDKVIAHEAPTDLTPGDSSIEKVWKYYMERPYLAGLFLWTGFDYRGEETPFHFPAISSQYGVLDLCGFSKDCFDYLKAWWTDEPVLFLSPHWNWKGKEGQNILVRAFSNCEEVELFLNGKSLGKESMPVHSHLEWQVPYEPGLLSAKGYKDGKVAATAREETTGEPASVALVPDRAQIKADGEDVSVVTVEVKDNKGKLIPTARNEILFSLEGPGRIIGVGNGDPSCHEPDKYFETVSQVKIAGPKMMDGGELRERPEVEFDQDDSNWKDLFQGRADDQGKVSQDKPAVRVIRASFDLPQLDDYSEITLLPKSLVDGQAIYVNGHLITEKMKRDDTGKAFPLAKSILKKGRNVYAVVGTELLRRWDWENLNGDPGSIRTVIPAGQWKRSLFSGLAQVIVQSDKKPGSIVLKASSEGLSGVALKLESQGTALRPSVPAQ
jgi:beta-galactosidase